MACENKASARGHVVAGVAYGVSLAVMKLHASGGDEMLVCVHLPMEDGG